MVIINAKMEDVVDKIVQNVYNMKMRIEIAIFYPVYATGK